MFISKKKLNEMLKEREEKIREEYMREERLRDNERWHSERFNNIEKGMYDFDLRLRKLEGVPESSCKCECR